MTGCPSCDKWARQTIPTMTGDGQRAGRECPDCGAVVVLLDERPSHLTTETNEASDAHTA